MNFRDFILQQSPNELEQYAKDAGTTVGYIKTHLKKIILIEIIALLLITPILKV